MLFVITFRFNLTSYQSVDLSFSRLKLLMLDMTRVHLKKKKSKPFILDMVNEILSAGRQEVILLQMFQYLALKGFSLQLCYPTHKCSFSLSSNDRSPCTGLKCSSPSNSHCTMMLSTGTSILSFSVFKI